MPRSPYAVPLVRPFHEFHAQKKGLENKQKGAVTPSKEPKSCIVLSDDDDDNVDNHSISSFDDDNEDALSNLTITSRNSGPPKAKRAIETSSSQSTPSKKPKLIFGKEAKRWEEGECQLIHDHLLKTCDRVYLQKVLGRAKTSVAAKVEQILKQGLTDVVAKANKIK